MSSCLYRVRADRLSLWEVRLTCASNKAAAVCHLEIPSLPATRAQFSAKIDKSGPVDSCMTGVCRKCCRHDGNKHKSWRTDFFSPSCALPFSFSPSIFGDKGKTRHHIYWWLQKQTPCKKIRLAGAALLCGHTQEWAAAQQLSNKPSPTTETGSVLHRWEDPTCHGAPCHFPQF